MIKGPFGRKKRLEYKNRITHNTLTILYNNTP
jgi:hypothetical protein